MEAWLALARGPLFRFTFAVMVLGLLRNVVVLIWGVIVILFVSIGISKFSAYEGNPELLAVLDSMPPTLMSAFNMEAFNLTTLTGFFGVMFTYFALMLSIAAAMWGSDTISKDDRCSQPSG